jgi:hypothetical protein
VKAENMFKQLKKRVPLAHWLLFAVAAAAVAAAVAATAVVAAVWMLLKVVLTLRWVLQRIQL